MEPILESKPFGTTSRSRDSVASAIGFFFSSSEPWRNPVGGRPSVGAPPVRLRCFGIDAAFQSWRTGPPGARSTAGAVRAVDRRREMADDGENQTTEDEKTCDMLTCVSFLFCDPHIHSTLTYHWCHILPFKFSPPNPMCFLSLHRQTVSVTTVKHSGVYLAVSRKAPL